MVKYTESPTATKTQFTFKLSFNSKMIYTNQSVASSELVVKAARGASVGHLVELRSHTRETLVWFQLGLFAQCHSQNVAHSQNIKIKCLLAGDRACITERPRFESGLRPFCSISSFSCWNISSLSLTVTMVTRLAHVLIKCHNVLAGFHI